MQDKEPVKTDSSSFIKLDKDLIRVLGVNTAIVFCNLYGLEKGINTKRKTATAIYQTYNVMEYETGLSKQTLIKSLKELTDLKLIHIIRHTERNKTKYKIDYDNFNELQKIIKKVSNKKASKNLANKKEFQRVVLNLYNEYIKNDTISSDNFNTTDKDLIEKDLIRKRNKYNKTFSKENVCFIDPITINYSRDNVIKQSITYYYISMLFKDPVTRADIIDIITSNATKDTLDLLEYFMENFYNRYNKYHRCITLAQFKGILEHLNNAIDIVSDLDQEGYIETFKEIIDEYFKTQNKSRSRELTIHLFLAPGEDNSYPWIDTICKRLYSVYEDQY